MKDWKNKNSITDLIIGLKPNMDVVEQDFNGIKIKIKQYIGITEKQEFINYILENSLRNKSTGLLINLDTNKKFDIALINFYTNYKFDIVNKDYFNEVYDILEQKGFFSLIVDNIPTEEYNYLNDMLLKEIINDNEYHKSIAAGIARINDTELNIKKLNELMNSFNKEDMKEIKNIMDNINSLEEKSKDKAEQKESSNK